MNEASRGNHTYRAPNGKFFAIWRGRPVCMFEGVLLYFETERDAQEFLVQCDAENRLVEYA